MFKEAFGHVCRQFFTVMLWLDCEVTSDIQWIEARDAAQQSPQCIGQVMTTDNYQYCLCWEILPLIKKDCKYMGPNEWQIIRQLMVCNLGDLVQSLGKICNWPLYREGKARSQREAERSWLAGGRFNNQGDLHRRLGLDGQKMSRSQHPPN